MRNYAQLLQLRRAGMRPAFVRLTDQREDRGEAWWQHAELRRCAEIHVEADDSPMVADLRGVVGLPVLVDIPEPERCMRWAQAAKAAGAVPVYAMHPECEVV
jgi:hypothetical protein